MALILVVILAGAMCACGGSSSSNSDAAPAAASTASASGEEAAAATGAGIWDGVDVDIQLQCHQSSTEQLSSSYDHMIGLIDQVTDGHVKITAYENGSLYSVADCLDAVGNGDILMCEATEASWSDTVPVSMFAAGVPYMFSSYEQAYMFMYNRGFYDLLNEAYAKVNIHVIPYECYTAGLMTKKKIESIDDFKGLKLRASGTMAKFEELLGVAVTQVAPNELYNALSQNLIEGVTWGAAQAMVQMNFQEVCQYYLAEDPIIGQWNSIYVNLDWWNSLTTDQQNSLESAIIMAGYHRTVDTEANNDLTKNGVFADAGVEIVSIDKETRDALAAKGLELCETLGQADEYSARALEMLKAYIDEWNQGSFVYNNEINFNHKA